MVNGRRWIRQGIPLEPREVRGAEPGGPHASWLGLDPAQGAFKRPINAVTGFGGKIAWNADKPDGAMMKVLDVSRMKHALDGWAPPTSLKAGLAKTIAWYRANKAQADAKW